MLGLSDKLNSPTIQIQMILNYLLIKPYSGRFLLNLFLNSVQATEKNNQTKISVKTYQIEGYINIEISDNASGIPNDIQKRVFEPLFSSKKDGFGLGLSLCSDLLSRHKGSIEIKHSSPLGTIFLIRIPDLKH